MFRLIFGGIIGALAAYFFDAENGKRRRNEFQDRFGGTIRQSASQVQDLTGYASTKAQGVAAQATSGKSTPKRYDDATLTDKVKTELYGKDPDAKGRVSVNVQDGVVQLRGELGTPDQIQEAKKTAESVEGVTTVENLMHLPGAPVPTS